MKGIDFLEVMGEIDEAYISEIEQKKVVPFPYKKVMSYAASFLLICTLSVSGYQYYTNFSDMNFSDTTSSVAEVTVEDMGRAVEDIPSTVAETYGTEAEITSTDSEKNIFGKIFENIVSFFKSLRF